MAWHGKCERPRAHTPSSCASHLNAHSLSHFLLVQFEPVIFESGSLGVRVHRGVYLVSVCPEQPEAEGALSPGAP